MAIVNSCQIRVGRLLEVDVAAGYRTVEDVTQMIVRSHAQFAMLADQRQAVVAADWRACKLFTPEVSERVLRMMVGMTPHIERAGILHLADQATSILQVVRLARECQFVNRQIFTRASQMERWLGEVLDPAERQRLHAFLAQRS